MDIDHNTAPDDGGHDSDDSMPELQSVSNSSDSESSEHETSNNTTTNNSAALPDTRPGGRYRRQQVVAEDDGDDAWTDDDGDDEADQEMPPLEPISAPVAPEMATGSRRTRRAEDQDQERDRRHPSQRTAAPNNRNNRPNPPPPNPTAPHFHLPHVHPPVFTTQLMTLFAGAGLPGVLFGGGMAPPPPPKDSPENAAKIIAGLERVPEGLVRRLERLSEIPKDGGEELGAVGGDSGCAICWDKLLDGDGAAFTSPADVQPASDSAATPPKEEIIALPCAHLFHASCLAPWFARPGQTTCPTCRFDVDPQGLIWYGGRKAGMGGLGDMGGPGMHFHMPFPIPGADGATGIPPDHVHEHGHAHPWTPQFGDALDDMLDAENPDDGEGEMLGFLGGDGGFAFEWAGGPMGGANFPQPTAPEDDEDEGPPPLEPIPGRTAARATANDEGEDDMPPLEPIQAPQASASRPSRAATVEDVDDEDDLPPPLERISQASTSSTPASAPEVPPQTQSAPAPSTNTNAPPPPHAHGQPAFTFGLDIVFSTLGPIPPPADLHAAGGVGDALGANPAANPTAPPPPPPGAPGPGPAFTFPGVSGVGLNTGAGRGRGGVMGAFGQLFTGFGAPQGPGGQGRGRAGNVGGLPAGFQGIQFAAGPGGFGFQMNPTRNAPQPAAAGHPNVAPPNPGAPPQAQPQDQAQAQAAQTLGMAMLRALGLAPPTPQAGAAPGGPATPDAAPGAAPDLGGFQLPPWLRPPGQAAPNANADNAAGNPPPMAGAWNLPFAPTRRTTLPGGGVIFEFGTGPGATDGQHFHTHPHAHPDATTNAGPQQPPPPPQEWAPPPPPGPTFRQRVERREREAGLRCYDASCGVGPSDEDPFVVVDEEARRMVPIYKGKSVEGEREKVCDHKFHPACLVSAQRASRGWREPVLDGNDSEVEVACSVCRAEGVVPQADWLAGTILPLD